MSPVTLYTTTVCPYCHAAKRLLAAVGAEYSEVRLDQEPELRRKLSEENGGWRTVPMIFIGGRFVGGFAELRELHGRGELAPLLESAGAPLAS